MTTIHDRIKYLVDILADGKNTVFARKIGVSEANIRSYINGVSPKADILSKIVITYDVDPAWLLTGNGDTLKNNRTNLQPSTDRSNHSSTRPRIPFTAQAGALTEMTQTANFADVEQIPVIATFPDYDFTIPVDGDSMSPEYLPGDELACAKLSSTSEIKWGRAYLLDTARGVVVKQIFDGGDRILCHSVNPDHKDYVIDKSDIYSIYAIVGYTRTS